MILSSGCRGCVRGVRLKFVYEKLKFVFWKNIVLWEMKQK